MTKHESMRGYFAYELYQQMKKNRDIFLVVGDLGYLVFDQHFKDFPDRVLNTGAAEQTLLDAAVGLAYSGKVPICYTITPFFYRGFETIRTYINHEKLNVKLIGSGRDKDYHIDGFSHDASDIKQTLGTQRHIKCFWPQEKEEIPTVMQEIMSNGKPCFVSLVR